LASKGQAVLEAIRLTGEKKTIIAAGDDENDISLLSVADISIAMAHAPKNLIRMAHLIAPPTVENGIIPALKMAIARHGK
jgi:hydroxymethylpyrimidine pyrophosphatase-like HAD family hydrolase